MKKKYLVAFSILLSFLLVKPVLAAEEPTTGIMAAGDETNVATGFRWEHCTQVHHAVGDTRTWCYLDVSRVWAWTTDNVGEQLLIACAESNHWCGVNFTSTAGTWNFGRMYKY